MRSVEELDYTLHIKTRDGKEFEAVTMGPNLADKAIQFMVPIYDNGLVYPIFGTDEFEDYFDSVFFEINHLDQFMKILKGEKVRLYKVGRSNLYEKSNIKEVYVSCKL